MIPRQGTRTNPRMNEGTAGERAASDRDNLPPGFAEPPLRALAAAGYRRRVQFAEVGPANVLGLHGVGPKHSSRRATGVRASAVGTRATRASGPRIRGLTRMSAAIVAGLAPDRRGETHSPPSDSGA
jgi:hypothetical protein